MAATVADLLIERLIEWGVDTIFGLPGDGINGLFEALRTRQDRIRFIQVRHEEAAAFAACGYAKYTGRLGVCLATSGPGGIHLLNGLYDAKCDGQPVLAITGHTFHDLIGTYYQQDISLDKLFMDVSAYNERIMGPAHVCNVVDEAIKTALARRTVAHITIPKDMQEWKQDGDRSSANIPRQPIDFAAYAQACGAAGYSVDEPNQVSRVLWEAFAHPGPALVEAVVDPHEPPLPGKITTEQALHFAEALIRGQKDRWEIIKTVVENKIREVV